MPKTAPKRLILDTDIVIHLLKKHEDTVIRFLALDEAGTGFLLSPIVVAEIYAGAFEREHQQIKGFIGLCRPAHLDHTIARLAGKFANRYRKAYQGISLEDYLLAATAVTHRCPLWTGNRKHYPMEELALFDEL